jgi:hypothetical protein
MIGQTQPYSATVLREVLRDCNEPIPAYLRVQVRQMTYHTVADSEKTVRHVTKALSQVSPHVKWKALELLSHLCIEGHPSVRALAQELAHNVVRGCAAFDGTPDEVHGDFFNIRVRESATRCLSALVGTESGTWRQRAHGAQPEVVRPSRITGYGSEEATTKELPPPPPTTWLGWGVSWASWAVVGVVDTVVPYVVPSRACPPGESVHLPPTPLTDYDPPMDGLCQVASAQKQKSMTHPKPRTRVRAPSCTSERELPPDAAKPLAERIKWCLYWSLVAKEGSSPYARVRTLLETLNSQDTGDVATSLRWLLRSEYGVQQTLWTLRIVKNLIPSRRRDSAAEETHRGGALCSAHLDPLRIHILQNFLAGGGRQSIDNLRHQSLHIGVRESCDAIWGLLSGIPEFQCADTLVP